MSDNSGDNNVPAFVNIMQHIHKHVEGLTHDELCLFMVRVNERIVQELNRPAQNEVLQCIIGVDLQPDPVELEGFSTGGDDE